MTVAMSGAKTSILFLFPHTHLRGSAFRYELVRPDGSTELLLDRFCGTLRTR